MSQHSFKCGRRQDVYGPLSDCHRVPGGGEGVDLRRALDPQPVGVLVDPGGPRHLLPRRTEASLFISTGPAEAFTAAHDSVFDSADEDHRPRSQPGGHDKIPPGDEPNNVSNISDDERAQDEQR